MGNQIFCPGVPGNEPIQDYAVGFEDDPDNWNIVMWTLSGVGFLLLVATYVVPLAGYPSNAYVTA